MNTTALAKKLRLMDLNNVDEATKVCNTASDVIMFLASACQEAEHVLQQWQEAYDNQAKLIEELEARLVESKNEKRIIHPH